MIDICCADYYCTQCRKRWKSGEIHWNGGGWACCPECYSHDPHLETIPGDRLHRMEEAAKDMILKRTDEYTFVYGNAHKALLKNNAKDQYEVWREGESGRGSIIWCRYETPSWLVFDHVASEAEVQKFHI